MSISIDQQSLTLQMSSAIMMFQFPSSKENILVEANVTLLNDMQFTGTASSGHTLTMDADDESCGHNAGFRPMELLLVAFGGCTGMDVISILRKKQQQVSGLKINVKGEKSDIAPKIFKTVHIEYVVQGRVVEKKAVERAIKLSLETYCSVGATLSKSGTITHTYRIIEE
jgi:putative redox protein